MKLFEFVIFFERCHGCKKRFNHGDYVWHEWNGRKHLLYCKDCSKGSM